MELVYCAHEFGGDEENIEIIEDKIFRLREQNPNTIYFSPVHAFGWLYDSVDYEDGLEMCLSVLDRCDKMLVMSQPSRGVRAEVAYAARHGIDIEYAEGIEPGWFI